MNEIFEKIYNDNNTGLNESSALFEKIYTEAEMLNEMNPKLKALLAAGLIGTASLGAASCSMPTDDPTIYEQPAPENPEEIEDSDDSEDLEEIGNNGGEETVTFESLGVTPEHAVRLAGADEFKDNVTTIDKMLNCNSFIYKSNEDGFVPVEFNRDGEYKDGSSYISYIDDTDDIDDANYSLYYVPVSMESDFKQAIATYKAVHAE